MGIDDVMFYKSLERYQEGVIIDVNCKARQLCYMEAEVDTTEYSTVATLALGS
jgi:hypothetical protein